MTIRDIVVAFGFDVDRNSEREAQGSIKGIANLAKSVLGAIGIGFSIAGLSSLAEAAADVEALESQFTQVFGDMEAEAAERLQAVADDTGVQVNRMKGSFSGIAAFAKVSGVEQAEALEISERAMVAVADSAAYYDRSIEDVTESLRSFLKGNYENDAALGLSATETTRNAAANDLYGKSFKDLSEAEKQFTLLKMVEDANAASGALGQAARESDTWTNQLGNLKQELKDLKAAAGAGILKPAVAVLKLLISLTQKAKNAIAEMTGENGIMTRSFDRLHALVKRLKPAIDRMMQGLALGASRGMAFIKGVVDRLGGMENVLKILAMTAAAFFAVMAFAKAAAKVKKLYKEFKAMDKVLLGAKLKVLALVAVLVILGLIVEDFVNFLLGNDSVIGSIFDRAGIGADNARKAIFDAWNKVKTFLLGAWDLIRQAGKMFADSVRGFFEEHAESVRKTFERAWGIVRTFLSGVWTVISQIASALFGDTEDSIGSSTDGTKEKVVSTWQDVLNALSAIFGALLHAAGAVFHALFVVIDTVLNVLAAVIEAVFSGLQAFWNAWGDQVVAWFVVVWGKAGNILNAFLNLVTGIADFISAVFTGDWQAAWDAVGRIFSSAWDIIVNLMSAVWETLKLLFSMGLSAISALWKTVWGGISGFFRGIWDGIVSFLSGVLDSIRTGISERMERVRSAIMDGFQAAVDFIKGLPAQAVQWGADFIGGLIKGITSKMGTIGEAVKGVGGKIKSFLHFSVPDEGPLTDYESWMPDFMSGLAQGIRANEHLVLDQVRGLVDGISVLMQAATAQPATAAGSMAGSTNSSVIQNVNISNSYSGGSMETQRNVSRAMKKSASDATTYMARGLAYARG